MNKTNRYARKKIKEVTYKFLFHKERKNALLIPDDNEVNGKLTLQNSANHISRAIMARNILV